jgi:hypothetical protein
VRNLVLATTMLALGLVAGPVFAQSQGESLISGSDVDTILAIAQRHGSAEREDQMNGNPGISGMIGDADYYIYFVNCDPAPDCEDINFYAGFYDFQPTLESINEWNRDRRFGKAYLDQDGDAVVELDINLEYGVTADNLDASFQVWALVLSEFAAHIGYE